MEEKEKNKIYDRLLDISFKIELQSFPNPQYINEKIGECHVYIGEIERHSIEVTKEISVVQQAYNNALADYEVKKENLLIQNEGIKSLPNIKDREAKANSMLKEELKQIREYENTLTDLNNLLKAINLKLRNLNRANTDIRMMVRVLESQIKLGMAPATDPVMKSLVEEMNKGKENIDSFEDVEAEVTEETVVDPTEDLNIDELLSTSSVTQEKEPTVNESHNSMIDKGLIDPIPEVEPEIEPNTIGDVIIEEEDTPIVVEEDWPEIDTKNIEIENESDSKIVDLDSAIDFSEKGGETQQTESKESEQTDTILESNDIDRQQKKEEIGIDIDELLNDISFTKGDKNV